MTKCPCQDIGLVFPMRVLGLNTERLNSSKDMEAKDEK